MRDNFYILIAIVSVSGLFLIFIGNFIFIKPALGASDASGIQFQVCVIECPTEGGEGAGGTGGGGGAGRPPSGNKIVFSGKAYPSSNVFLLKDGQFFTSAKAQDNTNFEIVITNITAGSYNFSIYTTDSKERKSSLFSIPLEVKSDSTIIVSNIILSPTIAVNKKIVKKNDNISIFGQSIPNAFIAIKIVADTEELKEYAVGTFANGNGEYIYNFSTKKLDLGDYIAKSKVILNPNLTSNSSLGIEFEVGIKEELIEEEIPPIIKPKCPVNADFNKDCKVNLVDFSILIYYFDKPSPPTHIDLNKDRVVNLTDFSIMAYNWTG